MNHESFLATLYSSTSTNNSILAGVQYIFIQNILPPYRVLTKCWNWEVILTTNFGSLCQMATKFGSQNFGYQIWFCTSVPDW